MKVCSKCKTEKSLDEFGKRKDTKDGRKYYCQACAVILAAAQRAKSPDKESKRQKAYYRKNREKRIAKAAKWTRDNRGRVNKRRSETGCGAADRAKYRAAKKQQTPPWADLNAIRRIYSECARLSRDTGVEYHVDHIYPIQSDWVSGLHVPHNLQVIPASDNRSKGNRRGRVSTLPLQLGGEKNGTGIELRRT
jgi:hypothetical protein